MKIRLARHWRKKRPFYRIVLTEHTKPAQCGYKDVLGSYDPLNHELVVDVDLVKEWIGKGVQLSERVAKLIFAQTKDTLFEKFIEQRERNRTKRKEEETA